MRMCVAAVFLLLSACASEQLSLNPPAGVDFSGQWVLNEADSDEPQHLIQSANGQAAAQAGDRTASGQGGSQGGGRGRGGLAGSGIGIGPPPPSMGALREAVRWPGKRLEIKQVGGTVAFVSEGRNRLCQPSDSNRKPQHRRVAPGRDDSLPSARDAPPPVCGWFEKSLIVKENEPDEDRPAFDEHYVLSEDGLRLVEIVEFKGGRSSGYSISRVWDRAQK